jgi:hypothetical protein
LIKTDIFHFEAYQQHPPLDFFFYCPPFLLSLVPFGLPISFPSFLFSPSFASFSASFSYSSNNSFPAMEKTSSTASPVLADVS